MCRLLGVHTCIAACSRSHQVITILAYVTRKTPKNRPSILPVKDQAQTLQQAVGNGGVRLAGEQCFGFCKLTPDFIYCWIPSSTISFTYDGYKGNSLCFARFLCL